MSKYAILGKKVPFIEGKDRATGRTRYVTDMKLPNMLYGKVLRSPFPHARILSIDTSKAKKLPGVHAVLTYDDTTGDSFGPLIVDDWYILSKDKVTFIGEEIVAVAAVDPDIAEEAISLIKVEYQELPAVFDAEEAMQEGAPLINENFDKNILSHFFVERGNVDKAFAEASYIFEDRFTTSQVYQAHLEPVACLVEPHPSGDITMWLPIQIPSRSRVTYAKALGLPPDKIRIIKPDIGGAFGAKFEHNLHIICALLALKTRRPVKMVHTLEEDFIAGNPRVPMYIDLKLGLTNDGKITAKEVQIIASNGARHCMAIPILSTACYRIDSLYTLENIRTNGYLVYTNTVPKGSFRGFGNAQMTFALESALDEAARQLDLDPIDLRLKNAPQDGHVSVHGWKMHTVGLSECLKQVRSKSNWDLHHKKKEAFRGIGVACCNHVSGNSGYMPEMDGSAAFIRIAENGKITVFHGEADMGQGQNTCYAIIAAEELGVKVEDISVAEVDTDIVPFGLGSYSSRGTVVGGNAVKKAAADARYKLLEAASNILKKPITSLNINEGKIVCMEDPSCSISIVDVASQYTYSKSGAHIFGYGEYNPDTVYPDLLTKYGNTSPLYPFAAHVAEVEVDPETGAVTVLNYWAAHDVGRVINRLGLEGQVEGGVVQGIGWALMEDMVTENGKILNPGFLDYRVPGSLDIPPVNSLFIETDDPNGPFGAKGIGEPALNPVPAAIANAVYDAIGKRIKELPLSPEKVFQTLRKKN